MKLFLLFLGAGLFNGLNAQVNRALKPAPADENQGLRAEMNELKVFRSKVDQFIILVNDEQWSRADFIKMSVIRDMKDEIQRTQKKIRALKSNYSVDKDGRQDIRRNNQVLDKSSSRKERLEYSYEIELLESRLEEQERIMRDLRALRLGYGDDAWGRSKKHEKLMIQFEETMREDIKEVRRKRENFPK